MSSRLSAVAALFAAMAAASLAFAADLRHGVPATQAAPRPAQLVQLERVVVTAKRQPVQPR